MKARYRLAIAAAMIATKIWATSASAGLPTSGTISVEPRSAATDSVALTPTFVNAADEALAAKGLTILDDPGHAAYVAELTLSRTDVGTGSAKVPRGSAAVTPGLGVGAGVSVPLSMGETRLVPLQRIRLEMRIRKRGEDAVVWTGAAVTVRAAGTKNGADAVVAADLSQALLRSYPAQPEDVITIP